LCGYIHKQITSNWIYLKEECNWARQKEWARFISNQRNSRSMTRTAKFFQEFITQDIGTRRQLISMGEQRIWWPIFSERAAGVMILFEIKYNYDDVILLRHYLFITSCNKYHKSKKSVILTRRIDSSIFVKNSHIIKPQYGATHKIY